MILLKSKSFNQRLAVFGHKKLIWCTHLHITSIKAALAEHCGLLIGHNGSDRYFNAEQRCIQFAEIAIVIDNLGQTVQRNLQDVQKRRVPGHLIQIEQASYTRRTRFGDVLAGQLVDQPGLGRSIH